MFSLSTSAHTLCACEPLADFSFSLALSLHSRRVALHTVISRSLRFLQLNTLSSILLARSLLHTLDLMEGMTLATVCGLTERKMAEASLTATPLSLVVFTPNVLEKNSERYSLVSDAQTCGRDKKAERR